MVQPIDQGGILASGRQLVPDYAAMALQKALLGVQQQQAQAQQGRVVLEAEKAQREAQQEAEYEAAVAEVQTNPTLEGYSRLMARFPQASEALKRSWETQDKDRKTADFRQMAQVHDALRNNSPDLAARVLESRIAADRAADGEVDPVDEQMLAAIKSGDPAKLAVARDMARRAAAIMAGPEQFSSVYKTDDPKLTAVAPGTELVDERNPGAGAVYSSPYKPESWTDPATGVTYRVEPERAPASATPAPAAAVPGAPAVSVAPVTNAAAVARELYPNARITDWRRDPKSALGRKNPKSWHVKSGAAVDTAPIPGLSFEAYVKSFRDRGFTILEARDEVKNPSKHATGPHWHVAIGVPKVNSKQQYASLPSGAQFYDPQGNLRRKP